MGEVADKYCEKRYITSDNPRNEDPQQIANMIARILKDINNESLINSIRNEVQELCKKFPLYPKKKV